MDETKIQRLARLGALRDSGALTDDEFKAQKAQVLGMSRQPAELSPNNEKLSRIETLLQSGALSEAEAATEKSKILRPIEVPIAELPVGGVVDEVLLPSWAAKPKKSSGSPVALIAGMVFLAVAAAGAAWWWTSTGSVRSGEGDMYVITGMANARSAPTTAFSSVVKTLSAGDRVRGRWVEGRNASRWLETSGEPKTYIWEGNLRLD